MHISLEWAWLANKVDAWGQKWFPILLARKLRRLSAAKNRAYEVELCKDYLTLRLNDLPFSEEYRKFIEYASLNDALGLWKHHTRPGYSIGYIPLPDGGVGCTLIDTHGTNHEVAPDA